MAEVSKPANYQTPLSDGAYAALDELEALLHTQLYNIQQAGMCDCKAPDYQARAEQMLAMVKLIKAHFPRS